VLGAHAQCYLILAHLQHSEFNRIALSKLETRYWSQGCAIGRALKHLRCVKSFQREHWERDPLTRAHNEEKASLRFWKALAQISDPWTLTLEVQENRSSTNVLFTHAKY